MGDSEKIYPSNSKNFTVMKKFSEESPVEYQINDPNIILEEKEPIFDEMRCSLDLIKKKNTRKFDKFGVRLVSAVEFPSNTYSEKPHQGHGVGDFSNFMTYWSGSKKLNNRLFNEVRLNYNPLDEKFTCKSMSPIKMEKCTSEWSETKEKKTTEVDFDDNGSRKSLNVNNNEEEILVSNIQNKFIDNHHHLDNQHSLMMDTVNEETQQTPKSVGIKVINRKSADIDHNLARKPVNKKKVSFFDGSQEEKKMVESDKSINSRFSNKKKLLSQDDVLKIVAVTPPEVPRKRSASFEYPQIKN